MKTITSKVSNEIIIKNSKFIGLIFNVTDENEIKSILEDLRKKHKDATHITYAWRLDNKQKFSDDGEPTGTAGNPIMEVILKNDLINTLIVVIRYFGGIKLGAGGLIRAYSKVAREVLKLCTLNEYIKYNYYRLTVEYDDLKLLNSLTNDLTIETKSFDEKISYIVKIKEDEDNLNDKIKNTKVQIEKL